MFPAMTNSLSSLVLLRTRAAAAAASRRDGSRVRDGSDNCDENDCNEVHLLGEQRSKRERTLLIAQQSDFIKIEIIKVGA